MTATSSSRRSIGQPPLPGSPAVSTCASTPAPGSRAGDLERQALTVDGLVDPHQPGDLAHLVGLQLSDEVHIGTGRDLALGEQLLGVVLPDRTAPGGERRLDRLRAESLRDRQHGDRVVTTRRSDAITNGAQRLTDADGIELGHVTRPGGAQQPLDGDGVT